MATKLAIKRQLGRAITAAREKKFEEAVAICDDLLERHPGLPHALAIKGTIRAEVGDQLNAILLLENAIMGDARVASWHASLSALYMSVYRCADAVRSAGAALRLSPNSPQYLVDFALALQHVDDHDQAMLCLLRAVGIAPNDAVAHLTLGQMLLARGEMDAGWIEYEWRNKLDSARHTIPRMTSALWNGMRLPGRLFVIIDQGYGDTIQFSRYLPLAAARCDELLVGSSPELAALLSPIQGVSACLTNWEAVPGHAAHIRMSSLPYVLRTQSHDGIFWPGPYLKAPGDRVEAWKRRLESLPPGVRVGFVWRGRTTHPNDRSRSVNLATFKPLMQQRDIQWVSLQKPIAELEETELAQSGVLVLSEALTDFAETAAVMANLDLVITIDTAVAHLAGALGCPVWIMLPKPADWRWMLKRSDTLWYPSMRLFRQDVPGGWDQVVSEVGRALRDFPKGDRAQSS